MSGTNSKVDAWWMLQPYCFHNVTASKAFLKSIFHAHLVLKVTTFCDNFDVKGLLLLLKF